MFTIHAGEYLTGLHIQRRFPKFNLWLPTKDTGTDLLVTDAGNNRAVSLQVKYGKDFLPDKSAEIQKKFRCLSWFTLNSAKLDASSAELWVFVLHSFKHDKPDFVVIPKDELRNRMAEIHGVSDANVQSYLCSTETNQCWEVRMPRHDTVLRQIADGSYKDPKRDFTKYLNDAGWGALIKKVAQARVS
jgi:hypothetical protein